MLRSQDSLADAESRLLRSQTDLSVALVELKRATGELLQTAPLPQVSDHMVQQVSYQEPSYQDHGYQDVGYPQSSFQQAGYQESSFEQSAADTLWSPPASPTPADAEANISNLWDR